MNKLTNSGSPCHKLADAQDDQVGRDQSARTRHARLRRRRVVCRHAHGQESRQGMYLSRIGESAIWERRVPNAERKRESVVGFKLHAKEYTVIIVSVVSHRITSYRIRTYQSQYES